MPWTPENVSAWMELTVQEMSVFKKHLKSDALDRIKACEEHNKDKTDDSDDKQR